MNSNTRQTFRACVLRQVNKPLEIIELQTPTPSRGQVLVKLSHAAVCHSQLMEVQGKRGEDKYLPHCLGHEGIGHVISIGDGVTKVKVGDKVVLGWIKGEGIESGGTSFLTTQGEPINAGAVTTFSELSIASENRLVKAPAGIADELLVLLGCAIPTGAGIILNQLKPNPADRVLIIGLGGIGMSALLALNHLNVEEIHVIDKEQAKRSLALKLGAKVAFSNSQEDQEKLVETAAHGYDAVIEASGQTANIERGLSLTKKFGGRCIFASHPPKGEKIQIDPYELICGKRLEGSWGGSTIPDRDTPIFANIIREQKNKAKMLISSPYKLEEINQAFDDLGNGKVPRAIIDLS